MRGQEGPSPRAASRTPPRRAAGIRRRLRPLGRPSGEQTTHTLVVGDARTVPLRSIGAVQLILTSPPYWNYPVLQHPEELGFERELSDYLTSFIHVLRKCYVQLDPGGCVALVLGDPVFRERRGAPLQVVPLHKHVVNAVSNDPWMELVYLGSRRWREVPGYRARGPARSSATARQAGLATPGVAEEFLTVFRKVGGSSEDRARDQRIRGLLPQTTTKGAGHVWSLPRVRAEHPSAFPEALADRVIRHFTGPGDTVLDPFVGGGTTMRMAAASGRNSVGVEIGFRTRSGRRFVTVIREAVLTARPDANCGTSQFRRIGPRRS